MQADCQEIGISWVLYPTRHTIGHFGDKNWDQLQPYSLYQEQVKLYLTLQFINQKEFLAYLFSE